ncbi:RNA polymerase sigma-70 factor [Pedobacter sp. HMF7647]|uniref:RNA polymerase sigma-70 factor n=2 Tax=Hufsiella arboris TaxID=2695275 RepID=A0A7K1Y806_9SPHI|nr:RNA polymerase sigma-70 factor [Hufsiella arboris]
MAYSERETVDIRTGETEKAFEKLFRENFKSLHAYAFSFVKDNESAEEIVQNVFFRIWEKNEELALDSSLKAYLFRSVHNESLNQLKRQKIRKSIHISYESENLSASGVASEKVTVSELQHSLQQALLALPQQCRTIFQLSRFDQLKYRQIAEELGISVKTVENQMGKALKILRVKLAEFLIIIFALILNQVK